jgi:hypothetical protein
MNKDLIRDLAITGGIYDCICDPYDKLKNGDPYSSVMLDLERFTEKVVRECLEQVWYTREDGINGNVSEVIKDRIKQHFGIEE